MKLDPDIYREAAACLAHDDLSYEDGLCRGMCVAIISAMGTSEIGRTDPYLNLLERYFRPDNPPTYWWDGLDETTQAERFMCLHFMALIAEDL